MHRYNISQKINMYLDTHPKTQNMRMEIEILYLDTRQRMILLLLCIAVTPYTISEIIWLPQNVITNTKVGELFESMALYITNLITIVSPLYFAKSLLPI